MVLIEDIAERCDLTVEIVSKALGGASDISLDVRDRVQKAAKELGFAPRTTTVDTNRDRSWTICVLCHDETDWGLNHYLFSSIIESFRTTVERHGYDIIFVSDSIGKRDLGYYGHCKTSKRRCCVYRNDGL